MGMREISFSGAELADPVAGHVPGNAGQGPRAQLRRIASLVQMMFDAPLVTIAVEDGSVPGLGGGARAPVVAGRITEPRECPAAPRDADGAGGAELVAALATPLVGTTGEPLGEIAVHDLPGRHVTAAERLALEEFAHLAVTGIELWHHARRDGLTGALTRTSFMAELRREVARSTRSGAPLALVMFDLDHFKRINDTLGHAAGDAVLRAIGAAVPGVIRCEDGFGRLGGEEFGLIVAQGSADSAGEVAERIRAAVAAAEVPGYPALVVTASVGVASFDAQNSSAEALMAAADAQLYAAKHAGRDCVRGAARQRKVRMAA